MRDFTLHGPPDCPHPLLTFPWVHSLLTLHILFGSLTHLSLVLPHWTAVVPFCSLHRCFPSAGKGTWHTGMNGWFCGCVSSMYRLLVSLLHQSISSRTTRLCPLEVLKPFVVRGMSRHQSLWGLWELVLVSLGHYKKHYTLGCLDRKSVV